MHRGGIETVCPTIAPSRRYQHTVNPQIGSINYSKALWASRAGLWGAVLDVLKDGYIWKTITTVQVFSNQERLWGPGCLKNKSPKFAEGAGGRVGQYWIIAVPLLQISACSAIAEERMPRKYLTSQTRRSISPGFCARAGSTFRGV